MLSHLRLHFFGGDNTTLICSNSPQQVVTQLNIAVARWMENRPAQWKDMATKPKISKRFIRTKGKNKSGQYIDPSNNADAFSVIE
jgi:hypothetical protein